MNFFNSLEQVSEGVTALIEDKADGHQYTVQAHYLLGCDGGQADWLWAGEASPHCGELLEQCRSTLKIYGESRLYALVSASYAIFRMICG